MGHAMKRLMISLLVTAVALFVGAAGVWAALGGHGRASRVTYETSESTSKLTFTGDVSFEYSGYAFSSSSAEIVVDKVDSESQETELRYAFFSGGVQIKTPPGGRLSSQRIEVKKISGGYEFKGAMIYIEGNFRAEGNRFVFDRGNETVTAFGGVSAVYSGLKGFRDDDAAEHELSYTGDGFIYDRPKGVLKSTGGTRPAFEFNGLNITAVEINITLSDEGVMGMAAAGDIKVEGEGISLGGLNALYDADTGELKLWGDVRYTRGGDELQAEDVIWHLREGGNRITVTGGQGTVGLGQPDDD